MAKSQNLLGLSAISALLDAPRGIGWEKRLEEHLHISALTGNPLSGLQIFAPMQIKESIFISTSKSALSHGLLI